MSKLGELLYEYQIKQDMNTTTATASISTIISGISSFVNSYFRGKFPAGFFKDNYISTELNRFTIGRPFPNQQKPLLAMTTEYNLDETSMGPISLQYTDIYVVKNSNKEKYYRKIFEDYQNRIFIYSIDNRMKLKFNFALKLQTEMQAWNVVNYINQKFEPNGKIYCNNIELPVEFPTQFAINIANKLGWPINDPYNTQKNQANRELLRGYLIDHSLNAITEETNLQTGNPAYYYNHVDNIMLSFPDIPSHEKNVTNLITKDATVRYSIEAEFWFPGSYIIETDPNSEFKYNDDENQLSATTTKFDIIVQQPLIPRNLNNGWALLKEKRYIPDYNEKVDHIDISSFFDSGMINIFNEIDTYKLDADKMITLKLYMNNILVDHNNYSYDLNNMSIDVINPERNATYTIVVYGDRKILAAVDKFISSKDKRDIKGLDVFKDYRI